MQLSSRRQKNLASKLVLQKTFIRMIVEAVSPIIPITSRNRSVDGGYLRTALTLLAAVEILVTPFEDVIRRNSNPAGAVRKAKSMHNDIERATLYGNQELKNIREFPTVLKAQYQTSWAYRGAVSKGLTNREKGHTIGLPTVITTREEVAEVMFGIMRNLHQMFNTGTPSRHPCVGVTIATTIELETVNVVAVVGSYTLTNKH